LNRISKTHIPGRARSKNAAACGWTAYLEREAGRHSCAGCSESRGDYDISRCPLSLMWMRKTINNLPFTQKVNIRRLLPVLCQMRCAQLEGLPCGDKPSRGAPHRSYQDGQARGQRIYSFECSTPGRAHGKHAVLLRGRVRTPGTLDTSILPFGWGLDTATMRK
jgi:hypothetical protein